MRIVSALNFGMILFLVGIAGIVFVNTPSGDGNKIIKLSDAYIIDEFPIIESQDVGFYKITINDFNEDIIFVQIFDSKQNIIHDKKIETKMSVNYFDINSNEKYKIILTNLSENKTRLIFEYDNLNYSKIVLPGFMSLSGLILMIFGTYKKITNQRIIQIK